MMEHADPSFHYHVGCGFWVDDSLLGFIPDLEAITYASLAEAAAARDREVDELTSDKCWTTAEVRIVPGGSDSVGDDLLLIRESELGSRGRLLRIIQCQIDHPGQS